MRLALVGDVIISRPLAPRAASEPTFAQTVDRLRAADVTFGNLETAICSLGAPDVAPWGVREDWVVRADPEVAVDLRDLGFDVMGRGNNHSMDWGVGGLRETSRLLDDADLAHAGAGETRSAAFAPAFAGPAGARVGLVSATTTYSDHSPALDAFRGGVPPRPGVAALRVRATITAPTDRIAALRELAAAYREAETDWAPQTSDALELFRRRFVPGDGWRVGYEVEPDDEAQLMDSIRRARADADLVLLALHVHQGDHDPTHPPAFLRGLAAAAVANGADVVTASGPHRIAPVELIDGRPVFYGLGNFVWSDVQDPLPRYYHDEARPLIERRFAGRTEPPSDAELIEALNDGVFDDEDVFRAVIAEVEREDGALPVVTLVPVELGSGRDLPDRGVPAIADREVTAAILDRVGSISAPLGAQIDPDGTVRV